jgi:hypothetical protein
MLRCRANLVQDLGKVVAAWGLRDDPGHSGQPGAGWLLIAFVFCKSEQSTKSLKKL